MSAVCPWCSAALIEDATECPSCGANLVPDGEPNVPGVTAVDAASIIRSKTAPQPRSRLLSWISGEYASDTPSKDEAQAIAPPDLEVRREILRLELEAEVANLQAKADSLRAEAAAEGRVIEGAEGSAQPEAEPGAEDSGESASRDEGATAAAEPLAEPASPTSGEVVRDEGPAPA